MPRKAETEFPITVDAARAYTSKPDGREASLITNRMKASGPMLLTQGRFCEAVRRGHTWTGATYPPRRGSGWGEFQGQQVFGLDFDNGTHERPLEEGEEGYLHPLDALRRLERLNVSPMCLYFTFSATPEHPRYRIVIDMGEVVRNEDEAKTILKKLLGAFPEADQSCKNPNKIFYGSNGEVWELWDGCHECKEPLTCPDCWVAESGERW